jgi:outer membrane protein OmpA-like peptidoglycan-associated protein
VSNLVKLLLVLTFGLTLACTSSKPISSNKFEGFSEIEKGEVATMSWDFANAEKVKVESYDKDYNAIDSAKVSPEETTEYKITALHDQDTVAYMWVVDVKDFITEKNSNIVESKKEEPKQSENIVSSYKPNGTSSKYINGSIGPEAAPVRLKITNSKIKDEKLELETIILDENGNFINGLNSKVVDLSFIQLCSKSSTSSANLEIQEVHKTNGSEYSIVFDNSAVAEFNFPLLERVLNFSESLNKEDKLSFSYFNQNFVEYTTLLPQSEFYDKFKSYDLPEPSGLSGLYKALYNNMVVFTAEVSKNMNKAVVLITYSEDNSSLIYSPNDIINAGRNFGIPVYIIAIGDAYNSYSLQKIANSTGGKLYQVDADSLENAEQILKEIDFAKNNHYAVIVDYESSEVECGDSYGKLVLKYGDNTVEDGIVVNPTKNEFHSYYQSVAIFDQKTDDYRGKYDESIMELANVLKSNPNYRIKLTGHSDDEGDKVFNSKVSDDRATKVKKSLVTVGVDDNQIMTDAEGFSKPLYILGQTPWQKAYNRRVELKWINPASKSPFEIIVAQLWTEDEAAAAVRTWNKRGYDAYFESYLIGDEPVYRVMLWGFENEDDAKITAFKIMKKYKTKVTYK